ncbi:MAG: penicillin-binding transpeptidase domain-containing protein [Lachnobacterium sp.]|nr:peptidoglycan glycosyltransferase [Lachnobacterium sp.]MCI7532786.1 peptidoglycan glycosyltransferase [Lachnobacterium sp.]MDD7713393.1 penicillin-binding transpeptidase domain-containing protein [Lachnobacterium sp.]MDY5461292.1 penicillin-binding transpeptidase domain-containing protein [Agathobacter sp.]
MERNKTYHRRKICVFAAVVLVAVCVLLGRLVYLMIFRGDYYSRLATDLQQRERQIKAARGKILDVNGVVLAGNRSVCTISVIHNQIQDPEAVIAMLVKELDLPEERVRKRVEKYSSIERIKSNVDKETGNRILAYGYAGVKVDEDYKREYPFDDLASKVLGFTGGDNQGIIGLETVYDKYLQGTDGTILTTTDARGVEVDNIGEERIEPVAGNNLRLSLDSNIQLFASQAAEKAYLQKEADSVSILVMNPKNGEILAMVDYPEFNLNEPFVLTEPYREYEGTDEEQEYLNQMWRNHCINDTYEPGSTFKIITSAAALEEGVVSLEDRFHCPGYIVVEDRRIRCHKTTGHGAESFVEGIENSCNPVFINVGLRIGADRFYDYFGQFGLLDKTHIDLPGEAATIMHKRENIGLVELATISFGQSFQITPIQLATTVSSIINGGNRVTPHFGMQVEDAAGNCIEKFSYEQDQVICSPGTSEKMRYLLEKVVSEGGGKKAYIEGYNIGGKTATSQTLPRSANRYISSFLGFAPADDPQVLVLVIIRNPSGVYYGGTIAAPVAKEIFENILPYLELQ